MDCVYIEAAPNNSFQPTRASEPHARCVVSLMLFLFVARAAEFGRWAASQFFLTRQREYRRVNSTVGPSQIPAT